ncbi:FMN-binding protein [Nocardioides acrostichi]|uniref:FMN-binding protein n=1 Tax=Nocardioides acrostichi TaxID=2784339 RepID=A0A930V3Z0_9ACTN|nr:FMN-binding protein [Nocardioides acrostichi]MBF4162784.1 FMN-binding protein [Nocardioides acrostichi]
MTRIVLAGVATVTGVAFLLAYPTSTKTGTTVAATTAPMSAATAGDSPSLVEGASGSRTVDGDVAQTQWGPVQVELALEGDTITGVTVLQYPDSTPHDAQINAYALPILVQATVEAQSAQIDMVSGATVTSQGYLSSLQSALDTAGI